MKCPRCGSDHKVKNGIVRNLQRYKCKECSNNYTVEKKSTAVESSKRRLGLMMYLEGLGFNSIGRILGVSHVAVIKWIKRYGSELNAIKNDKPARIVEADEMHSYIGSKKTTVGYGLQLIEMPESTLVLLLGTEEAKQGGNFGNKLNRRQSVR